MHGGEILSLIFACDFGDHIPALIGEACCYYTVRITILLVNFRNHFLFVLGFFSLNFQ